MKKLDKLLITSFIPPFIVTFMIAIFVLLMQILWLYIDDIAGKGVGFFILVELIAYKCVGLIPMALPLAILISSVMVIGGLAERYELSSFKSAGVPLLRVMRPIIIFGVFSMFFSYLCSNNLIPVANLKFGSRMYDIQKQKPALRLDAGTFNDDFENYSIYIGKKGRDGRSISDVLIYDHRESNRGELTEIIAERGEMYATPDGRYFIMYLENGHQYIEASPTTARANREQFPFVRTSFHRWKKVFDLSEFQLARTNEELFKQNRSMMSSGQLRVAIDSIALKILRSRKMLSNQVASFFSFLPADSTFLDAGEPGEGERPPIPASVPDSARAVLQDSAALKNKALADSLRQPAGGDAVPVTDPIARGEAELRQRKPLPIRSTAPMPVPRQAPRTSFIPEVLGQIDTNGTFLAAVEARPAYDRNNLYSRAKSNVRSIYSQAQSSARTLDNMRESEAKHIYELQTKYSIAVVCIIFVFIGAPMGAIVRKGGFGYPILVSIFFFTLFIILTIFCRKIAETFVVPAALAGWIPGIIFFPIGLYLTLKAMNDSKLVNVDRYTAFFNRIIKKFNLGEA